MLLVVYVLSKSGRTPALHPRGGQVPISSIRPHQESHSNRRALPQLLRCPPPPHPLNLIITPVERWATSPAPSTNPAKSQHTPSASHRRCSATHLTEVIIILALRFLLLRGNQRVDNLHVGIPRLGRVRRTQAFLLHN